MGKPTFCVHQPIPQATEAFQVAFDIFLDGCQDKVNENAAQYEHVLTPRLEIEIGIKNIRIVKAEAHSRSRYVYCFVEIATGNVYKAASYKAPAKGVRSNIFSDDNGLSGVNAYGGVYR